MQRPVLFPQTRVAMVGRGRRLREIVFDSIGREPKLGGICFRWMGPRDAASVHSLAVDAEQYVRRLGYAPDAFAILGVGRTKLLALVPSGPATPAETLPIARVFGLAV